MPVALAEPVFSKDLLLAILLRSDSVPLTKPVFPKGLLAGIFLRRFPVPLTEEVVTANLFRAKYRHVSWGLSIAFPKFIFAESLFF